MLIKCINWLKSLFMSTPPAKQPLSVWYCYASEPVEAIGRSPWKVGCAFPDERSELCVVSIKAYCVSQDLYRVEAEFCETLEGK